MTLFNAFRDFAGGLSRGVSLYFTERNDFTVRTVLPVTTPDSPKRR